MVNPPASTFYFNYTYAKARKLLHNLFIGKKERNISFYLSYLSFLQREIYVCNVSCAFGHFQQVLATGDNVAVTVICGKTFFNQILSLFWKN